MAAWELALMILAFVAFWGIVVFGLMRLFKKKDAKAGADAYKEIPWRHKL